MSLIYSMKMYFELPNLSDSIVFELREQFGQIADAGPLKYSIPDKMEHKFPCEYLP